MAPRYRGIGSQGIDWRSHCRFTSHGAGGAVWAQPIPSDPIAENLFAPDLVLEQQRAIALTAEQQEFIQNTAEKALPRIQATLPARSIT